MVNKKCVFDINDVKSHPYNYCIKPPSEIAKEKDASIPEKIEDCDSFDTNCIASYGATMGQYIYNGFMGPPKDIISRDCENEYGNKYVVKTNNYCKYDGKKVQRYRYINNTRYKIPFYEKETHKIKDSEGGGLLGPIIGSGLTKLVPGNLFFSNTFDTQGTDLECRKVKIDCHFIDNDNIRNNTKKNKKGIEENTGCVYIPKHELILINQDEYTDCDENDDDDPEESFSNLEEAKKLFNSQNNQLNYDENINNIYYLLLSLLIIYLLFKLLNKKR
tara:strand:+ start:453 stop:1277 length:825 start_codon:yes stop_codon:yes gene_type:complete